MLDTTAFPSNRNFDANPPDRTESLFLDCFVSKDRKPLNEEAPTKTEQEKQTATEKTKEKTLTVSESTKTDAAREAETRLEGNSTKAVPSTDKANAAETETEKRTDGNKKTPRVSSWTDSDAAKTGTQESSRRSTHSLRTKAEDQDQMSPSQKLLSSTIKTIREKELPNLRKLARKNPELQEAVENLEKQVHESEKLLQDLQEQRKQRDQAGIEEKKRQKEAAISVVELGIDNFEQLISGSSPSFRLKQPGLLTVHAVYEAESRALRANPDANTDKYRDLAFLVTRIGSNQAVDSGFPLYKDMGMVRAARKSDLETHLKQLKASK